MKRLLLLTVAVLTLMTAAAQREVDIQIQKLLIAESAIYNLYVEELDDSLVVESAIKGMLGELDPHSTYLTAKEVQSSAESLNGNFDGIGVQFNMVQDTLFVVQPVPDGPSEKVGIMAGDRIVTVNDTAIAGVKMSEDAIKNRLRGPKGTVVKLGILRHGVPGLVYFNVTRDRIPVNTLDAHYMLNDHVGYIKISSFGATTVKEFETALDDLKSEGMTSLILDLQDNGGGYMTAAVGIANEFLPRGRTIVSTEGRRYGRTVEMASGNGKFLEGNVCVLIDEYSASASEIVSGALQDWDRAWIVGRRSYGKGLVQRAMEMPDGSAIRLTIAKYFTPSGRCIQKPYGKDVKYGDDIVERLHRGELMSQDSIHFADSLKFTTMVKGRTVYGGGGIMPDFFVPLDTSGVTMYYRQLLARGAVLQGSFAYIDANRRQLERRYRTFPEFEDRFQVDEKCLETVLNKAEELKIEFNEEEYNECLPILKRHMKALIARNLWSMNEYFKIAGSEDPILLKGLDVIDM